MMFRTMFALVVILLGALSSPLFAGDFDPARRVEQIALERLVAASSWEQALLRAREALSRFPDDPFFSAVAVKSLRTLGYREGAERLLTASLSRHPKDPSLLVEKGWLAAEKGEWESVLTILSPPSSDDIPDEFHILRSAALRETGRLDEALQQLGRIPPDSPRSCEAGIIRAKILYRAKKGAEALSVLTASLKRCPRDPEALRLRALITASLGDAAESLPHFREALSLAPNDLRTIIPYGETALALGERETARELLSRAMVIDPANDRIRTLRCTLGEGDPDPDCIDIALSRNPDDPELIRQAARRKIAEGKNDEALPLYDRLLSLRPEDHRTILERAILLIDMKRFDEAITACTTLIEKRPLAAAYGVRGYARHLKGDRTLVDDDVTNALLLDRFERTALLVSILQGIDRKNLATLRRQCSTMSSRYPGFLPGLAACAKGYLLLGDVEKGSDLAEAVIKRAPNREESKELARILSGVSPRAIVPLKTPSTPEVAR